MTRLLAPLALITAFATSAAAQGVDYDIPDPSDLVPGKFSPQAFSTLSAGELYDIGIALKRGRNILILGCTASQSRAVFEASIAQKAPDMETLRTTCGG